ncbi:dTDP-4-dehydrorhamnose reductase [Ferruginibacter sp.]|nr:dTDP-4-dehydrorhamnose reductase [Ferruginibacter sp.]
MVTAKTILITGANGQLGKELRVIAAAYTDYTFLFTDKEQLPIDNIEILRSYFSSQSINYCINCAAYTAVDKAETESETAFAINAAAVGNLAAVCKEFNAQLIHISTDYVFDGTGKQPYKETDTTNPVNVYGQSKLQGEQLALQNNPSTIIIRTSWVFSSFGNNFVKTMLRLMKERESINVVNDQYGCPTYAADLADAIMTIIKSKVKNQKSKIEDQVFNYCNEGIINWYQFAVAIKVLTQSNCIVIPIPTTQYPTPAKRAAYTALDTTLIKNTFSITIPEWKESLRKCLGLMR